MSYNPYDTADITIDFQCYYDSTNEDSLPEDVDCDHKWEATFEVSDDYNDQPHGQTFTSRCPKCGREAGIYVDTARERNEEARAEWEAANGRYVRGGW